MRSPDQKAEKTRQIEQNSAGFLSLPYEMVSFYLKPLIASGVDEYVASERFWFEKIGQDFKCSVPETKNRLSYCTIYQQLKAREQLSDKFKERFSDADPVLFEGSLTGENLVDVNRYDCLQKAALVGNLALMEWLIAEERGGQRLVVDEEVLNVAKSIKQVSILVQRTEQQLAAAQSLATKGEEGKEHKGVSTVSTTAAPLAAPSSIASSSAVFSDGSAMAAPEAASPAEQPEADVPQPRK